MMKSLAKMGLLLAVLAAGCNSDLYTKSKAQAALKDKPAVAMVDGFLDLRYTENRSAGFGLLGGIGQKARWPLLVGLQVAGSLFLMVFMVLWRQRSFAFLLPYGLMLSGAIGNLWSRLQDGYVIDFIHFHIYEKFNWPIFNLADIFITLGLALMIINALRDPKHLSPVRA